MHLVSAERAGSPHIDGERVCAAIEAIGDPGKLESLAARFALLSDPHRLAVLVCLRDAGPISVTDLALATGMSPTSVSQCLRLLRTAEAAVRERDGRIVRYRLADQALAALLSAVVPATAGHETLEPGRPGC